MKCKSALCSLSVLSLQQLAPLIPIGPPVTYIIKIFMVLNMNSCQHPKSHLVMTFLNYYLFFPSKSNSYFDF